MNWRDDPKKQVLYCGIDLAPFRERNQDRLGIRESLGLPRDKAIIGHVGRFEPQKNHIFLLDIVKATSAITEMVHFVFVGKGELRTSIMAAATDLGISTKISFLEARSDIPKLMLSVFDLFLLPSVYEGLRLSC